ncbi:unnamed protein product, partial [Urochloa humidicola]
SLSLSFEQGGNHTRGLAEQVEGEGVVGGACEGGTSGAGSIRLGMECGGKWGLYP